MRTGSRSSAVAAVILAMAIVGGCSTPTKDTAITYTYEPQVSFPPLKTYRWANARQTYRQDPLLEANVRFLADRDLATKGLALKAEQADLFIWMAYEFDYISFSYDLRVLTLNISRADSNELIWRGMASGIIRTDATSDELKKTVEGILVNFPPK